MRVSLFNVRQVCKCNDGNRKSTDAVNSSFRTVKLI